MKIKKLVAALATFGYIGSAVAAGNVLIFGANEVAGYQTNLANAETAAGNTPTIVTSLPTSLAGYTQVWDIRGASSYALTTQQSSEYMSYLQSGGALYLMGENSGYGPLRNASIVTFIQAAGGGTIVLTGANTSNTQIVLAPFNTTPHALTTVDFAAMGGVSSVGKGVCITQGTGTLSSTCGSMAFRVGTMSNAPRGSVVSVLDVNWLDNTYLLPGFLDNLVAFLTAQAVLGQGGQFVPLSSRVSLGAATVLDDLATNGSGSADMKASIAALQALTSAQKSAALEKLVPTPSRAVGVAVRDNMAAGFDRIASRLDGLRGNTGVAGMDQPILVATNGPLTGLVSGEPSRFGVWAKALATQNHQDAKDGYAGYGGKGWGLAFGADTKISNVIVGGAFVYDDETINFNDGLSGSSAGIKNYLLAAYASMDLRGGYVEGMASYSEQDYDSSRDTVVSGMAHGSFRGQQYGLRIGGGLPVKMSETITVTPLARIEYTDLRQGSYTESGGGALSLQVQETSATRVRSTVGVQGVMDQTWISVAARPFARLLWHHDFRNDGIDTTASFVGGGLSFRTPGQKIESDVYDVGIGVNLSSKKAFSATVSLDQEFVPGYRSLTAQLVGRWLF